MSVSWINSAPHRPQVMVRTLMLQVYTTKDWTEVWAMGMVLWTENRYD